MDTFQPQTQYVEDGAGATPDREEEIVDLNGQITELNEHIKVNILHVYIIVTECIHSLLLKCKLKLEGGIPERVERNMFYNTFYIHST